MQEIWKDIESFEGIYQISNFGRIKSFRRNKSFCFIVVTQKERILKGWKNTEGYVCIRLWKDNVDIFKRVHRLVAEAFIPNPENKPNVNHIDGNKSNNHKDNLEWSTQSENVFHAYNTLNVQAGFKTTAKEIANKKKIKIKQFTLENIFVKEWNSASDINKELGICRTAIVDCCKGLIRKSAGFKWEYCRN